MEMVNLRHGGHTARALGVFQNAWLTEKHYDVIIRGMTTSHKCHKIILAGTISYFRDMLDKDRYKNSEPVIFVIMIPDKILKQILEFVYIGEINIEKSDVTELMRWAEHLGVLGITEYIAAEKDSTLIAADGLCILQTAHRQPRFMTTPKHIASMTSLNQPNTGAQPPQQEIVDWDNLRYKAAATRTSFSPQSSVFAPTTVKSNSSPYYDNNCVSPHSPAVPDQIAQHHRHIEMTKHEDHDSDDSDSEQQLHIDEGPNNSPMQYCEENMYVDDEPSEPQDLRIESRQAEPEIRPPSRSFLLPTTTGIRRTIVSTVPASLLSNAVYSTATTSPKIIFAADTTTRFINQNTSDYANVLNSTNNNTLVDILKNEDDKSTIQKIIMKNNNNFDENLDSRVKSVLKMQEIRLNSIPKQQQQQQQQQPQTQQHRSNDRAYTIEQLTDAVEKVINNECAPVEAITQYKIPRRTFFRHLKTRRIELGIPTKSKSSSRAASPSSQGSTENEHVVDSSVESASKQLTELLKNITSNNIKNLPIFNVKQESTGEVLINIPNDSAEDEASDSNTNESENNSSED